MTRNRHWAVACSLLVAVACKAQYGKICTHIEGEVADTAVQVIRVRRVDQNNSYIYTATIPYANGRFSYDIHTAKPAVYSICAYNKRWIGRAVDFFAEGDTVRMRFVPDDSPKWCSASPLNKELLRVNGMTDSISLCYRARFAKYADYDSLSEAERKEYKALSDSYHGLIKAFRLGYMRKNPGLVGLFMLFEWGERFYDDSVAVSEVVSIYDDVYAGKFPGFHLSEYMKQWRASQSVKVGGRYVNFTAPDLEGNYHKVSEEIKGKVALIDFWASWCGPCRMEMPNVVANYKKYHPKGFEIVGISFDKDASAWQDAIKSMGMDWPQLSDLKGWNSAGSSTYGIRSIPSSILVDGSGRIVDVDLRGQRLGQKLKEIYGF